MATSRPSATISYNSESFLVEVLDRLYRAHKIQAWQYIKHKGEDGDKDHIHVRIEPNCSLDLMEIQEMLREFPNGDKSGKPLGCRPFRYSKEEDWFLYAVHDPQYLALKYSDDKPEDGKIPYEWQSIQASEFYDVETAFLRAKASLRHTAPNAASRLEQGAPALSLVKEGFSPVSVRNMQSIVNFEALPRAMAELEDVKEDNRRLQRDLLLLLRALKDRGISVSKNDDGLWNIEAAPIVAQGSIDDDDDFAPF